MCVQMWKFVLLMSVWTKESFCLEFNFVEKKTPNTDSKEDIISPESVGFNPNGDLIEIKGIYYSNGIKPRIFLEHPPTEEFFTNSNSAESEEIGSNENEDGNFQPWSILWYIGSFGGLIVFFLIVSCSEWCCRARLRNRTQGSTVSPTQSEVPPPAYDLFAPPSYDSLCKTTEEKREYDVYVVPVHALEALRSSQMAVSDPDSPPSYSNEMSRGVVLHPPSIEEHKSVMSNSVNT